MQIQPFNTTCGDICLAALKECGAYGVGQTPLAEDSQDAQARLQWMLQQWERKRWLVYHLVDFSVVSTGAQSYSVGPGGDMNTDAGLTPFNPQFNPQFGGSNPGTSVRPAKLESAFLRQITQSSPNQIDYPLEILQSREDYNRVALKKLSSFPGVIFYDSDWPLGRCFPWPIPQASIYELHISIMAQLPPAFMTLATKITLPYEYYGAMMYNLAIRLRPKYSIPGSPGDPLPGLARDSLNVLRGANAQIARLTMPPGLLRGGLYNIFSDRNY